MIGYYVHHHGSGHLHRAMTVAPHLPDVVTGFSSLPRPESWAGPWVQLPRDDEAPGYDAADVTAQGRLHWVPLGDPGLRGRMSAIATWIEEEAPKAMVVDQSVEVCLLTRLHGIPVVALTAPGRRTDAAHRLGLGSASAVVGAWPAGLTHRLLPGLDAGIGDRVQAVGAVSRFGVPPRRSRTPGRPHAVLLAGTGGDGFTRASVARAQEQTPDWDWTVLSRTLGTWHRDPAAVLATADVAVLHPGQNSLAEVASLRLPAIVVPAARPFDEQHVTAAALDGGWPAVVVDAVPTAGWRDLLDEAFLLDGEGWAEWCDGGGTGAHRPRGRGRRRRSKSSMNTTVVTVVHGRHDHLSRQRASLAASTVPPDHHVVVAVDDPVLAAADWCTTSVAGHPLGLPIAAARNRGAREAIERSADVLVFLDVDCLADAALVEAYADVVRDEPGTVWSGPVTYLEPPPADGYDLTDLAALDSPHPARPAPSVGERVGGADPDLFWSLSFACSVDAWRRTGGFCESYVGYGGEDTDFAHVVVDAGLDLGWVGAARAFHQWHPVSRPPVEHVDDILRNAGIYRTRWGATPMLGWLEAFEERGLVHRDDEGRWLAVG